MTALIDADSLVYIIAWNFRDFCYPETISSVHGSCDNFLKDILTITGSSSYIGSFSAPSEDTFRNKVYKYAKYKGNRPVKPDYIKYWEPVIKNRFVSAYGFILPTFHAVPSLEADDVIAGIADLYISNGIEGYVICSPDKDLNQIPGLHYDYRAKVQNDATVGSLRMVHSNEAHWNFWTQMLTGDENDNVAGVPGLGPVKAKKIINELMDNGEKIQTRSVVLGHYQKYFGQYYGNIIFDETEATLGLISRSHKLYDDYSNSIKTYAAEPKKWQPALSNGFFDLAS